VAGERFGVTEDTWRKACVKAPGFAISESPTYLARDVAALAAECGSPGLGRSHDPDMCSYFRQVVFIFCSSSDTLTR
jgi:hypothetical protein